MTIIQQMTERLRRIAINDHLDYPQYNGQFDNWILANCVSKKTHNYKGGSCLVKGRWVLASPDLTEWYDPDNGHICKIDSGVLKAV